MARSTASRKWMLTINNPVKHGFPHDEIKSILSGFKSIIYWCMADEIGSDGTYHTHIFICGRNAIMFSSIKTRFPPAHIEFCKGTAQQNRDYVFKIGKWLNDKKHETCVEGTSEEFGECPVERSGAGKYGDLMSLIEQGFSNDEIYHIDPSFIACSDKIDRLRLDILQGKYESTWRTLTVSYLWGDTAAGKTRSVMDKYGYPNVYRVTNYDHPFDSYSGQDVVIFEEFRSSFKITDILSYLDGYPLRLPARYSDRVACYTKVYINSNIPIGQQYSNIQRDEPKSFDAFLRRINNIYHFTNGSIEREKVDFLAEGFRTLATGEFIPFDEI